MKPWIVYSAIRVSFFVALLFLLLALGVTPWLAAIIAAVLGLCVAYIFFRPQRDKVAASVERMRSSRAESGDEAAEDQ